MFVTMYSLGQLPKGLEELYEKFQDDKTRENAVAHDTAVLNFRKDFELPCWPYNEPDPDGFNYMDHFCEHLRSMDIIYYDDGEIEDGNKYIAGPIFPFPAEFYSELEKPRTVYRHRVFLYKDIDDEDKLYTPMSWPNDDMQGQALKAKIDSNPMTSDGLAWGELNLSGKMPSIVYGSFIRFIPDKKKSTVSQSWDTSRFNKKKVMQEKKGDEWQDVS